MQQWAEEIYLWEALWYPSKEDQVSPETQAKVTLALQKAVQSSKESNTNQKDISSFSFIFMGLNQSLSVIRWVHLVTFVHQAKQYP